MVSTAKYFLPRLLAQFRQEHPGIDFRLSLGNREALVRQLRDNEVDLAVMGRPPRELETRAEPFAAHPHAVIASAIHRLSGGESIPPAALAGEGFIVREQGSGTRSAMEQFFRDHGVRPAVIMEMTSNETIKQAVIANMGLSFLSLHTLGLELEQGLLRIVAVDGLPLVRRWHIVNMSGRTLSPAAEAFRYFILEHAEVFLAKLFPASLLTTAALDFSRSKPHN
jgi:DNA-binding transcriptional LysR family regulator